MVGLPTETDEDIDAIVRLVKGMEHHARHSSEGKKGFRRLTLSINQFIPKPATPFQWHPLEDTAVVKRRIRRITDAPARREGGPGHPRPPEVELHPGPALAWATGRWESCCWRSIGAGATGRKAFREVNVNPDFYVYRRKETEEILPWDFIDHGVEKTLLVERIPEGTVRCHSGTDLNPSRISLKETKP